MDFHREGGTKEFAALTILRPINFTVVQGNTLSTVGTQIHYYAMQHINLLCCKVAHMCTALSYNTIHHPVQCAL